MHVTDGSVGLERAAKFELSHLSEVVSDEWELDPANILVDQFLREGAFGEVYKGFLNGPLSNTKVKPEFRNLFHIPVALKLLKGNNLKMTFSFSCFF